MFTFEKPRMAKRFSPLVWWFEMQVFEHGSRNLTALIDNESPSDATDADS